MQHGRGAVLLAAGPQVAAGEAAEHRRAARLRALLDAPGQPPAAATQLYVLELSSFQLESTFSLAADAAVILNLSDTEQTITITDKSLHGPPLNTFMGVKEPVTDKPWKMEPWGYVIYEY